MRITYIYGCNNFLSSAPLSLKGIYFDVMPHTWSLRQPGESAEPARKEGGAGTLFLRWVRRSANGRIAQYQTKHIGRRDFLPPIGSCLLHHHDGNLASVSPTHSAGEEANMMRIICAGDQHDPVAGVLLASVPLGDACSAMLRRIAAQIDNTDHVR